MSERLRSRPSVVAACVAVLLTHACSRSDATALREAASWLDASGGAAGGLVSAGPGSAQLARVGDGLVAKVTGAGPALRGPVAMTVSDRGDLFVVDAVRTPGVGLGFDRPPAWAPAGPGQPPSEPRSSSGTSLRVLIDDDRDGSTDRSRVLLDGREDLSVVASAGVLGVGRDLYVALDRDLLRVRLADGDVAIETVEVLFTGFGARADSGPAAGTRAVAGAPARGLRGPVLGPDGRLYFSIGDGGAHVSTGAGGWLDVPDTGAVLRCELDGAALEVVASGLRDPQRLAFDADGNLFTADSLPGESGSRAAGRSRLVHIVAGGDYGWRSRQERAGSDGPSRWSDVRVDGFLPGIESPVRAPAGLAFHPGTGFDPYEIGRFVLCEVGAGLATFEPVARGASFGVEGVRWLAEDLRAVDATFGPDGALWVTERAAPGEPADAVQVRRIHRVGALDEATVVEVRRLLRNGVEQLEDPALVQLLGHPDLRLRVGAHLALASRPSAHTRLRALVAGAADARVRLHALWSLGVAARRYDGDRDAVVVALRDADAVVRARAARFCGELDLRGAGAELVARLDDEVPGVQLEAALALARVADASARAAVLAFVARIGDQDPFLSHAGVQALRAVADPADLERLAADADRSVRRAALLALRREGSARVAAFLSDPDASLRTAAARAIHDVPILGATTQLADRLGSVELPAACRSRAIAAANRAGRPEDADRLARLARDPGAPTAERVRALRALAHWGEPDPVDPVLGAWRPLDPRDPTAAREVVALATPDLVRSPEPEVFAAFVAAVRELRVTEAAGRLAERIADEASAPEVRAVALAGLAEVGGRAAFGAAVEASIASGQAALVEPALGFAAQVVDAGPAFVERVSDLANGDAELGIRQEAIRALGSLRLSQVSERVLMDLLERIDALPEGLRLDVLDAAAELGTDRLRAALAALPVDDSDPLARWRVTLEGGDRSRGEEIFTGRTDVSCWRCHAIGDVGGDAGPALDHVGAERTPDELLGSVLFPAATGSGRYVVAMPDDARRVLSRRELRDLIAFLRSLR